MNENLNTLIAKKAELQDRLNRIRRDLKGALEADSSEQAIQLENRQVLMELERVETANLNQVEQQIAALQR